MRNLLLLALFIGSAALGLILFSSGNTERAASPSAAGEHAEDEGGACRAGSGPRTSNPARREAPAGEPAAFGAFHDWLAGYRRAPERERSRLVPDGVRLAKVRRESLRKMIRRSPAAALESVLTLADYRSLPAEILPLVEKPVSRYGDIDLEWATDLDPEGKIRCAHRSRLSLGMETYDLHGPGRRHAQQPVFDVPVVAYLLDELALLDEEPLLRVSGDELAAAQALFPAAGQHGLDPVTGKPVDPSVAAVIGGKVYRFMAGEVVDHVSVRIAEAEARASEEHRFAVDPPFAWLEGDSGGGIPGAPVANRFFDDDNIEVLFIRCDFSDFPGPPVSKSALQDDLDSATAYTTISGHLNEMSYGKASVTATVTTTLYRPAGTGTSYALSGDNDQLYDDVMTAYDAAPDSGARSNFDVVAVYFPYLGGVPGSQIQYGGRASVAGSRHWINGLSTSAGRISVITHEFGHNYGLYHSNYWDPSHGIAGDYLDPAGNSLEYGDIFDRMGDGALPEGHFNMFQKHQIEWLPDSKIAEATTDGAYRIYRFDHIDADDNPLLALKVPVGQGVHYWIGYRQLFTANTSLANGAYVVAEGLYPDRPNLIDMTPGSASPESSDREDAGLRAADPAFVDGGAGVTITTLGTGGTAPDEWIDVQVEFDTRVGFAAASYEFDEAGGLATVTLERNFGSSGSASVDYATANGTATAGADYHAHSGTVTWADGDTADKQIAIALRPDTANEGAETFTVTLSNPSGSVIESGGGTATVSILDPGQRYAAFTPGFFNSTVRAIAFQSGGSAIIGGNINHTSGDFLDAGNIARLSADGSVDALFNNGGAGFNGEVLCVVVQDDDKILVGGEFTTYNGTTANRFIRLASDGSIDTAFLANIGTGPNAPINTIALEDDGEILVGGDFSSFNGVAAEGLVRLSAGGASGTALSLPFVTSWNTEIEDILVESDGKIMVTGSFYIGWTGAGFRSGVARLNAAGTRDAGFDPDAGLHDLAAGVNNLRRGYAVARLPGGDYVIGGWFTAYDENAADYLVRIDNDGSFDRVVASAFNDSVHAVLAEPFGGVIFGGRFTAPDWRLARISPAWGIDSAFTSAGAVNDTSFSWNVYALAFAPDGALWVGGNFFEYNGSSSRPVVRLASGVSPYDFWAAEKFTPAQIAAGDAAPDEDPDGDRLDNIVEMALGTNPVVADGSSVFGEGNLSGLELVEVSGSNYLQMTLDKSAVTGGAWYCVQLSSDLTTWSPDPPVPGDSSAFEVLEDSAARLVIRDKTPLTPGSPRFARLVIKSPE